MERGISYGTAPEGCEKSVNRENGAVDLGKEKESPAQKKGFAAAAAGLVLLVGMPNISAEAAEFMGNIPLVGGFFRVVTLRDYEYSDGHSEARVAVPGIEVETIEGETPAEGNAAARLQESAENINMSVDEAVEKLLAEFEAQKADLGDSYQELDISYEVQTNTDTWFTLRIDVLQVQASGNEKTLYYHLDKTTGNIVELSDLFRENSDYVKVLSDEIKKQMEKRMEADETQSYFCGEEWGDAAFEKIKPNQNFYFNEDGNLVIAFDEYEVAPGYMGIQEFTIPAEVLAPIRK